MAVIVHDRWLEMHRDEPSQQTFWPAHVGAKVFAPPPPLDLAKVRTPYLDLDPDWVQVNKLETWCLQQADEGLAVQGLVVDEDSRRKFAKAIAAAVQRASVTLAQLARGERAEAPGPLLRPAPVAATRDGQRASENPVPFKELVEGWAAETKPAAKTLYEWRRVLGQLATFVGHDDASRLTADDLIA
jgi:hypothetical protein